jgi:hypothetical protein
MQMEVLRRILTNTPREQALALYNAMTGESATQEDLDLALKPKKKASILTIEKELLNSYCEAVADMKKIKEEALKISDLSDGEALDNALALLDTIITKHVDRIKNSGIWD